MLVVSEGPQIHARLRAGDCAATIFRPGSSSYERLQAFAIELVEMVDDVKDLVETVGGAESIAVGDTLRESPSSISSYPHLRHHHRASFFESLEGGIVAEDLAETEKSELLSMLEKVGPIITAT